MPDDRELLARTAVVVVSYNTIDELRDCLRTLSEPPGDALEVVVVDNHSDDGSADMVVQEFPHVGVIRMAENAGFGRAANAGAAEMRRDFLVTLNPDCLAPPSALATLARTLDGEPDLGFAGPRIVKASGRIDAAALRGDPDPVGALLYFSRITKLFPRSARVNRYNLTHLDYASEQDLLAGTAGCLMFRAADFREVGGFDESFFMYGEDLDLCRRLRKAGHPGRYVPSAEVLHIKGSATRQRSQQMLVEFHRAMWVYYAKHEAPRRPAPLNWLVRAGITMLGLGRIGVNAFRREKRVSAR